MRTLWKGSLSFGLVTIPVRLYPATEDRSPSFNQLRASDHSRIGYQRVAKADGEEVDYDDIVKGYEYEPDRYVVFDREELEALKPQSSRTIEIVQFVPLPQIDPIYFQRSYYLAPDPAGAKAYGLLARAMRDDNTVAICKITLRDKEHLATVRLRGELFVLETMYWPDEIRDLTLADVDIDELPEPRPQEVQMATTLIENLTEDFDPSAHRDEYRQRVLDAVQAKVEGQEVTVVDKAGEPAAVVDLMEALKQSVEASTKQGKAKTRAS
ncbi:MAG TPA: Ku protein [Egibacteraceae bacterium]|nr:Ku protein [Actinomycetota bacterium]HWB70789.1 Ku protein [Egibacteraceae bacterium]